MNNVQQSAASQYGSAGQGPTRAPCRSWCGLHCSTWLVVGAVLGILTLIIVPGRVNSHGIFTGAPLFYEHGWPFVFLDRYTGSLPPKLADKDTVLRFLHAWRHTKGLPWASEGDSGSPQHGLVGPDWLEGSHWPFKGDFVLNRAGLALDVATAFVIVAAITFVWEWWSRKRWRCSLRCLLGGVVLLSATVAWCWWSIEVGRREARAVVPFCDQGFDVDLSSDAPVWLRTLVGTKLLRSFHSVVGVSKYTAGIGKDDETTAIFDIDLEHVNDLRYLYILQLDHSQVTDSGLAHIHDLPRLGVLILDNTRIEGIGLRHLKGLPRLRFLTLDNTQISDEALPYLKALPGLRELSLNGTKVTDEGVKNLQDALPNCKIEWGRERKPKKVDQPRQPQTIGPSGESHRPVSQ